MKLTSRQTRILMHMLGVEYSERWEPYRNHYCTQPDNPHLLLIEEAGLVERIDMSHSFDGGAHVYFRATVEGKRVARSAWEMSRPQRSPGQRRYLAWLEINDARPDLTFREFLTSPEWAEERSRASEGGIRQ